jgi:hypothetical protein
LSTIISTKIKFTADELQEISIAVKLIQTAVANLQVSEFGLSFLASIQTLEIFTSVQSLLLETSSVLTGLSGNTSISGGVTLTSAETEKLVQLISDFSSALQFQGMQLTYELIKKFLLCIFTSMLILRTSKKVL